MRVKEAADGQECNESVGRPSPDFVAQFMVVLDATIVNVALPSIQKI